MHVTLVTLSGLQYNDEALEVRMATPSGRLVIMSNHEPLTAVANPGPITILCNNNEEILFASYGGLLEVSDNKVRLLLDEVDHAVDLVEADIKAALEAAKQLKAKAKDQTELAAAQRLIDRQAIRLEVAQIRRKPRG